MKNWKIVKLGEVLKPANNSIEIKPFEKYKLLGMSLEGRGLFIREEKLGSEISSRFTNKVVANQFIYSRLFAWKGAFDYVKTQFEDCFCSDEFPAFDLDKDKIDIKFLNHYFNQSKVWIEVEQYCIGVTKASRNRFKEQFLLDMKILLPPLPEQQRIVNRLESLKNKIEAVKILRGEQERLNKSLLFSLFTDLVKGAKWQKMGEVAPLAKRPVSLQPNTKYNEIGARSFGKGTFDKPIVNSDELTWQKPNWIKTGDLLFSNIKAWEGAIAAVTEKDNDKIGSHRYLTFVPDSEVTTAAFLCFYFLTYEGLEELGNASPGSADRNRTLNTKIISNTLVPVPSLHLQKEFLEIKAKLNTTTQHQVTQQQALETLLPSALDKAFKGEW